MNLFQQPWFSYKVIGEPFVLYSPTHLWTIGVIVAAIFLFYFLRRPMQQSRTNQIIRYALVVLLVFGELSMYLWKVPQVGFSLAEDLPLQMCDFSSWILVYLLLSRKQNWTFDVVYYFGIVGVILALIFPEMPYNFPHVRYVSYMVWHAAIMYACFFLLWVEGWKPTSKSVLRVMLAFIFLIILNASVSYLTDGNYMQVAHKPSIPTPLDVMGPYPWYIFSGIGVLLVVSTLMYLPYWLSDRKKKEQGSNMSM